MSIPGSASPLLFASVAAEAAAFQIDRSLRFNSADSAYLNRTPSSAGNRKTWTWSGWVKRSGLGANGFLLEAGASDTASARFHIRFNSDNTLLVTRGQNADRITSQVFRDVSAWCHLVVAVDTTQATANDRIKIYFNGVQITAFSSTSNPGQNDDLGVNATAIHAIGRSNVDSGDYFNGYLADVHFIDGQALAPTDFGFYDDNNNWNPKAYDGTYGTNGFHLDFSDNTSTTTIAEDSSGNNNDWTANNFSVASGADNDSLIDTPTNYEASSGNNGGNYATLNPLISTSGPLSNGNLEMTGSNAWRNTKGTISVSSGKWYFEATYTGSQYGSATSNLVTGIGFAKANVNTPNVDVTNSSIYESILAFNQTGHVNNFNAPSSARSQIASGDVIGLALNLDAGTYVIYVNNSSTSSGSLNFTGELTPWTNAYTTSDYFICNFGQRPFAYTAPSGFKSLCTTNLPDPTIADGSTAFDTKLYSNAPSSVSGYSFSPDFIWLKRRSQSADHGLYDIVRGANKLLYSSVTNSEETAAGVSAFNSDGFDLGSNALFRGSGQTFVAWAWDGGSSTVSNTDGSITSNVRANPSAGFSIVSYTGNGSSSATVGHGLNASLGLIIHKNRDAAANWNIKHSSLPSNHGLAFTTTQSQDVTTAYSGGGFANLTSSSTFAFLSGTSNANNVNENGVDYIAYCFAPVAGYSAFGSYTGNGSSSDGPFVFTGFKVGWLMVKRTDGTGSWIILDKARNSYNLAEDALQADSSNAENSGWKFDLLSNGFKARANGTQYNASGGNYIYMAFASNPFSANGGLAR